MLIEDQWCGHNGGEVVVWCGSVQRIRLRSQSTSQI